ncbi:MAG: glycosyltransferase family 4 protein [Casimicrobiaceae bacterium]
MAAYTGGKDVPSARFRVRQYVETMLRSGIELEEFASRVGQYPPDAAWRRPAWVLAACAERMLQIPGSYRYDAVIFQRELLSTLLTLEPLFSRPRILDVDDAIWLHRRGTFAGKLAARCDAVICGNAYLADYFGQHCERVFLLPTAVDAKRFSPLRKLLAPAQIIGWSGTGGNLIELERIEPALHAVMSRFPKAQLRVICNRRPTLNSLSADRVEYVPWTPAIEVSALQDLQIGLMPLQDTAWTCGKCALKMLTYMSCGVPVVASPVGMNAEVLAMGSFGFGARTQDEWVDALATLLAEPDVAQRMGDAGRAVIDANFSVQVLSARLAGIIRAVAG